MNGKLRDMSNKINSTYSSLVIQKWLDGLSRDSIAKECGMSGGAVSAIIAQWKHLVGIEHAEQLRELAVALRKGGFSVLELAGSVRLKNILNQIGVGEESFSEFLTETYSTCKKVGLRPYQIATYLGDLVTFGSINLRKMKKSEFESSGRTDNLDQEVGHQIGEDEEDEDGDLGGDEEEEEEEEERYDTKMIPLFSQLPEYMASLKDQKTSLEDDIAKLRKDKNRTKSQYITLKHSKDEMLKKHDMVEEQLKWYEETRTELRKYGLSVDCIPEFVKSVRWIQDAGFPLNSIVTNFLNYADLLQASNKLEIDIAQIEKKKEELEQRITFLEELAQKHRLMDNERDALKKIGFGYKELKRLRHTIEEINEANNVNNVFVVGNTPDASNNYAVSKFLGDIETYYDDILGFQRSIDQQKAQIHNLTEVLKQHQQAISAIAHIGPFIMSLLQKGVTEDQILQRLVQLEKYPSIVNPFSEFKTDQRIKTHHHDPHLPSPEDSNTINAPTSNDTSASDDDRSQVFEPKGPNSLYFAEINLPVEWPSAKIESKKSAQRQLHDSTDSVMRSASEEEEEEEEGTGAHDSSYLYSVSPERTILPIVNISANGNVGKNVAENAIDGNFDTCWSNKGIGSWLLLDLDTRKNVQSIKIAWDQGNIFDYYYEISLSDNATNFKSVREGCSGGNSCSFLEYMLEQGSQARYIRITVKRNNYNDMAGITEIEVTGSPLRSGKTGKI